MTTEEINLKLFEKMNKELSEYRASLLIMPPEQILQKAYEYIIKEDLVYVLMENDLSRMDAETLLKLEKPLHNCYQKFELSESNYPQNLLNAIKASAHEKQWGECQKKHRSCGDEVR